MYISGVICMWIRGHRIEKEIKEQLEDDKLNESLSQYAGTQPPKIIGRR